MIQSSEPFLQGSIGGVNLVLPAKVKSERDRMVSMNKTDFDWPHASPRESQR